MKLGALSQIINLLIREYTAEQLLGTMCKTFPLSSYLPQARCNVSIFRPTNTVLNLLALNLIKQVCPSY